MEQPKTQQTRKRPGSSLAPGRRKLAYEIDHKPDGAYHLLTFAAAPDALDEVSRILKITDGVMRHLAVRRPKPGRTTTATSAPPREMAPSDTDREPEYAAPALENSSGARLQPGSGVDDERE